MQTRKTRASREKYKELRKIEKQTLKEKKAYNEETFEHLKKHGQHNSWSNMKIRKFYQNINKDRKKFKLRTYMDKNGNIISKNRDP